MQFFKHPETIEDDPSLSLRYEFCNFSDYSKIWFRIN